jgi:hypothetical protein
MHRLPLVRLLAATLSVLAGAADLRADVKLPNVIGSLRARATSARA